MAERPSNASDGGPIMDLHDELVDAAARQSAATKLGARARRRSARRVLVAAAITLIVGAGAVVGAIATGDDSVAADVNVSRSGDTVTVTLSKTVDVEQVRKALEGVNADVKVVGVSTGPSQRNLFVGIIVSGPNSNPTGGDGTGVARATFREGSKVELRVGIPAKPGQLYDAPTDAEARGEPLAGLATKGKRLGDVRTELEERAARLGVTLDYRGPTGQPTTTPDESLTILGLSALSPTRVVVFCG